MGNRRSVQKALETSARRRRSPATRPLIDAADGLVMPGVGAFPQAMATWPSSGSTRGRAYADSRRPLLGICLGMQLLFEGSSEFGATPGWA